MSLHNGPFDWEVSDAEEVLRIFESQFDEKYADRDYPHGLQCACMHYRGMDGETAIVNSPYCDVHGRNGYRLAAANRFIRIFFVTNHGSISVSG